MMMARNPCACCVAPPAPYNLTKYDPTLGTVIWQTLIGALNPVSEVEALSGTTDMLVVDQDTGGIHTLYRVDNTGAEIWIGPAVGPEATGAYDNNRLVDSTGTLIGCIQSNKVIAIDYSNTFQWTWTPPSGQLTSIRQNGTGGFIVAATNGSTLLAYNISSGGTTSGTLTGTVVSPPAYGFIGDTDSSGKTLSFDNGTPGGTVTANIRTTTTGALTTTGFAIGGNSCARQVASAFVGIDGGADSVWATTGINVTKAFNLTSIGGATGFSPTCCAGASGNYFYGLTSAVTGTGGTVFDFFKVNSGGSLQWVQRYSTSITGGGPRDMDISSDNYLYVGGTVDYT